MFDRAPYHCTKNEEILMENFIFCAVYTSPVKINMKVIYFELSEIKSFLSLNTRFGVKAHLKHI